MIRIDDRHSLDDHEVVFAFIRASGPGGQNVNKVSSAVQLRFDAAGSPSLDAGVRERLIRLAGRRANSDGVIVIDSRRHRTQRENRDEALERLLSLVRRALEPPVERLATLVPRGEREKRRAVKKRRSGLKLERRASPDPDEWRDDE